MLFLPGVAPLQQGTQGPHSVISVVGILQFHSGSSFAPLKRQGRAQPNTAVPVCSILKSDFGFKGQHLPRSPWLGVYNTGSGLPALMDSHPAWFSPGRPHCVILWLDGSARCSLPIVAQADAARLLGIFPVALGQRVPYAYTDLFCFQGSQPFSPGCDFIVADSNTISAYPVVTVPCGFVTVGG